MKNKTARPRVGLVGLGIMGSAMASNLMKAGFAVIGYDVDPGRDRIHRRSGGEVALTCRDLAERADMVICSLPSADALRRTAAEIAQAAHPPRIVLETSTLPVRAKLDAHAVLIGRGTTLLDCPLSGTGAQARTKDLVVFASGDRRAYRRAAPVFEGFARAHRYVGELGTGSKVKFVANLLVAIHNVAAAEALVLAIKAGLDPGMVYNVVADGGGGSRMLQVRGPMMVKGDYSKATMKLGVWEKDLTIIADFAREVGCPTPLFAASGPIYAAALAMCGPEQDTGAVCAALEAMARAKRSPERRVRRPAGRRNQ